MGLPACSPRTIDVRCPRGQPQFGLSGGMICRFRWASLPPVTASPCVSGAREAFTERLLRASDPTSMLYRWGAATALPPVARAALRVHGGCAARTHPPQMWTQLLSREHLGFEDRVFAACSRLARPFSTTSAGKYSPDWRACCRARKARSMKQSCPSQSRPATCSDACTLLASPSLQGCGGASVDMVVDR